MYGTCNVCCEKDITHDLQNEAENLKWHEWVRTEVAYEKNGKQMKAMKNVKIEKEDQAKELLKNFKEELKTLKKHVYNIKVQHHSFRQAVDKLKESEMVLVADFSENYNCKCFQEIQAHHFGGSREQVSLHTVVVYTTNIQHTKPNVKSYCTVSSSLCHQPPAIWAHLHPILSEIRLNYPEIVTVHFFSDGPFSQYRQKKKIYLSSTKVFEYGFQSMTWSFFEAGHGKGPADGIGGFLKRTADDMVATGMDIVNADDFYNALKDKSKIKLFLITEKDVESFQKHLPPNITTLKGTISVHQLFTTVPGQLQYRDLSCFCERGFCQCRNPKHYQPLNATDTPVFNIDDVEVVLTSGVNEELSSDDDVPLSGLRNTKEEPLQEITLSDLCKPRERSLYDSVYNNAEPSTSGLQDKENRPVHCGDFLLVNIPGPKGKLFRYVCKVNGLDEDGEMLVMFLRNVKGKQIFRIDRNDFSYIDPKDVVKILQDPVITIKRRQEYFDYKNAVDIFEK
jgi:hypothetical protein